MRASLELAPILLLGHNGLLVSDITWDTDSPRVGFSVYFSFGQNAGGLVSEFWFDIWNSLVFARFN